MNSNWCTAGRGEVKYAFLAQIEFLSRCLFTSTHRPPRSWAMCPSSSTFLVSRSDAARARLSRYLLMDGWLLWLRRKERRKTSHARALIERLNSPAPTRTAQRMVQNDRYIYYTVMLCVLRRDVALITAGVKQICATPTWKAPAVCAASDGNYRILPGTHTFPWKQCAWKRV